MPKLRQIASKIYSRFYGHLDDRRFRAKKMQEINDWIEEGDLDDVSDEVLAELEAEWAEYDATEIAQQR